MKPGDLVTTNTPVPEERSGPVIGIIVKELPNWDRRCFKVLWSDGKLLSEDSVDLEVVDDGGYDNTKENT